MAKGKKSVALFEVITAQQGKGTVERVPRPTFWKRLGLRRKPKLDLLRKAEQPDAAKSKQDELRHEERLRKAAALKLAQERAAVRAAKRAKADARLAEKQRKKKQRDEARAAKAAAAERAAVERAAAEKVAQAEAARAAADAARKSAEPAKTPAVEPAPAKAAAATVAAPPPVHGPLQMLRGIAKIESGRLVLTFDWITGSLAAAAVVLLCVGFLAIGAAMSVGGQEGRPGAVAGGVDPLAGQRTNPAAAGLPATNGDAGRIRPAEGAPLAAFRFEPGPNYVVVLTVPSRESAEKAQRFLISNRIDAVVVPVSTARGGEFEVVCTEGVTGLSDPRCQELAAKIRAVGKIFNAPPYRGGTDFSRLYLKKGTHYQ